MKRTWQPKKLPRIRKHGFRRLMKSRNGRNVIKRRRSRGRKFLTVTDKMRALMKASRKTKR